MMKLGGIDMGEKERKDKMIRVRMTEGEYDGLKAISSATGVTMSELLRRLMRERPPKIIEGINTDDFKDVIRTITSVGNLQKKLDNELATILQENIDISFEQFMAFNNQQTELRKELLSEIKNVKQILIELLGELR